MDTVTPNFWRVERHGLGPFHQPAHCPDAGTWVELAYARVRVVAGQHLTLDDLTDGQPSNWRSGCTTRTALEEYFGPLLDDLLTAGFRVSAYHVEEDYLITAGTHAAAYHPLACDWTPVDAAATALAWTPRTPGESREST